ncbi:hypothetical protein E2C01_030016 [Portunus trituberculatus]|uniref:Uncharacterized protein n=1 Tax=Portunus trituberculatus TaxID=210409 RepID=A0A5B7EW60_PORTR|nr:hypothetical protein [Portunus trituberculatus]
MNYEAIFFSALVTGAAVLVRLLVERSCRASLPSGRAWVSLMAGHLVAALMVELVTRDDSPLRPWHVLFKACKGMIFQITLWRVTSYVNSVEGAVLGCLAGYASNQLLGEALRPLLPR